MRDEACRCSDARGQDGPVALLGKAEYDRQSGRGPRRNAQQGLLQTSATLAENPKKNARYISVL